MFYVIQFIIGGTIVLLASWLSRSNFYYLSAIITLLPILTLLNLRLQIKSMTAETFHLVQQNAIFGAVGMVLFTVLIFYFSSFWKPTHSVVVALAIYAVYMIIGKPIMNWIQHT